MPEVIVKKGYILSIFTFLCGNFLLLGAAQKPRAKYLPPLPNRFTATQPANAFKYILKSSEKENHENTHKSPAATTPTMGAKDNAHNTVAEQLNIQLKEFSIHSKNFDLILKIIINYEQLLATDTTTANMYARQVKLSALKYVEYCIQELKMLLSVDSPQHEKIDFLFSKLDQLLTYQDLLFSTKKQKLNQERAAIFDLIKQKKDIQSLQIKIEELLQEIEDEDYVADKPHKFLMFIKQLQGLKAFARAQKYIQKFDTIVYALKEKIEHHLAQIRQELDKAKMEIPLITSYIKTTKEKLDKLKICYPNNESINEYESEIAALEKAFADKIEIFYRNILSNVINGMAKELHENLHKETFSLHSFNQKIELIKAHVKLAKSINQAMGERLEKEFRQIMSKMPALDAMNELILILEKEIAQKVVVDVSPIEKGILKIANLILVLNHLNNTQASGVYLEKLQLIKIGYYKHLIANHIAQAKELLNNNVSNWESIIHDALNKLNSYMHELKQISIDSAHVFEKEIAELHTQFEAEKRKRIEIEKKETGLIAHIDHRIKEFTESYEAVLKAPNTVLLSHVLKCYQKTAHFNKALQSARTIRLVPFDLKSLETTCANLKNNINEQILKAFGNGIQFLTAYYRNPENLPKIESLHGAVINDMNLFTQLIEQIKRIDPNNTQLISHAQTFLEGLTRFLQAVENYCIHNINSNSFSEPSLKSWINFYETMCDAFNRFQHYSQLKVQQLHNRLKFLGTIEGVEKGRVEAIQYCLSELSKEINKDPIDHVLSIKFNLDQMQVFIHLLKNLNSERAKYFQLQKQFIENKFKIKLKQMIRHKNSEIEDALRKNEASEKLYEERKKYEELLKSYSDAQLIKAVDLNQTLPDKRIFVDENKLKQKLKDDVLKKMLPREATFDDKGKLSKKLVDSLNARSIVTNQKKIDDIQRFNATIDNSDKERLDKKGKVEQEIEKLSANFAQEPHYNVDLYNTLNHKILKEYFGEFDDLLTIEEKQKKCAPIIDAIKKFLIAHHFTFRDDMNPTKKRKFFSMWENILIAYKCMLEITRKNIGMPSEHDLQLLKEHVSLMFTHAQAQIKEVLPKLIEMFKKMNNDLQSLIKKGDFSIFVYISDDLECYFLQLMRIYCNGYLEKKIYEKQREFAGLILELIDEMHKSILARVQFLEQMIKAKVATIRLIDNQHRTFRKAINGYEDTHNQLCNLKIVTHKFEANALKQKMKQLTEIAKKEIVAPCRTIVTDIIASVINQSARANSATAAAKK